MTRQHVPMEPSESIAVGPRLIKLLSLAYDQRLPALLEGGTGIGKSEIVHEASRQLGIDCLVLDLALLEPPDLTGLPFFKDGVTEYAVPAILPRDGCGILLLEELNRAERYIQQPALQLLSARQLNQYRLPDGWSVVAAINPENESYVVNPLDPALRARFLQLRVRADTQLWLAWARESGVHPTVLRLAELHDRLLAEVPPRSVTFASRLLHAMGPEALDDPDLLRNALAGYMRGAWVELLLQEHLLAPDEHGLDATLVAATYHESPRLQAEVRSWVRAGRTDRIDQLYRGVHAIVSGSTLAARIAKGRFSLLGFESLLGDLPGDLREGLQEAYGANPSGAELLSLKPDTVLKSYRPRSRARRHVQRWLGDPMRRHRALALASGVQARLQSHPKLSELRSDEKVHESLGQLVADLGDDAGELSKLTQLFEMFPRVGT